MTQSPEIYIHNNTITTNQLYAIERYINEYVRKRTRHTRGVFQDATYIEVKHDDERPNTLRILVEQDAVMCGFITYGVIRIEHPGEKEDFTSLNIYSKILNVGTNGYPQFLTKARAESKHIAKALCESTHYVTHLGMSHGWNHFTVINLDETLNERFDDAQQEDRYMTALCRHLVKTKATQHTPIVVSMHPISEGGHRVYISGDLPKHERVELIMEFSDTIHVPVDASTTQYFFY